jgi:hypothetical protein
MSRLWGIRHIRWLLLSIEFAIWWNRGGRYLGLAPNENDIRYLQMVWNGDA